MSTLCPVCASESEVVLVLSADAIAKQLSVLLDQAVPPEVNIRDYELRRCNRCTLEFANPMIPGEITFYDWITGIDGYYPYYRIEWNHFFSELKKLEAVTSLNSGILVDIGCGSGEFLKLVMTKSRMRAIGIDISEDSVNICRANDIEAYVGLAEDGLPFDNSGVNFFTLWHIVEHIQNPKGLLKSLSSFLAPNGIIFFSVPLSPTSFETTMLDPLNCPPHHMTRWTLQALSTLAAELDLAISIYLPAANNPLIRAILSTRIRAAPLFESKPTRNLILCGWLLRHPAALFKEFSLQSARGRYQGHDLPDVVMVRLTKRQQIRVTATGNVE